MNAAGLNGSGRAGYKHPKFRTMWQKKKKESRKYDRMLNESRKVYVTSHLIRISHRWIVCVFALPRSSHSKLFYHLTVSCIQIWISNNIVYCYSQRRFVSLHTRCPGLFASSFSGNFSFAWIPNFEWRIHTSFWANAQYCFVKYDWIQKHETIRCSRNIIIIEHHTDHAFGIYILCVSSVSYPQPHTQYPTRSADLCGEGCQKLLLWDELEHIAHETWKNHIEEKKRETEHLSGNTQSIQQQNNIRPMLRHQREHTNDDRAIDSARLYFLFFSASFVVSFFSSVLFSLPTSTAHVSVGIFSILLWALDVWIKAKLVIWLAGWVRALPHVHLYAFFLLLLLFGSCASPHSLVNMQIRYRGDAAISGGGYIFCSLYKCERLHRRYEATNNMVWCSLLMALHNGLFPHYSTHTHTTHILSIFCVYRVKRICRF